MKNSSDARRLINNELKSRSHNRRAKEMLEDHVPEDVHDDLKVDFYCECSDDTCTVRLPMTFQEYEKQHSSQSKFVLAPGHQSPTVEKVVRKGTGYLVVEKPALS